MNEQTMYGYSVGDVVQLKFDVLDEMDNKVPAGTLVRIVAIAPKVCIIPPKYRTEWHDGKAFFYNAVVASQTDERASTRIREDFCTIKKVQL